MKKGNRNFYDESGVVKLPDNYVNDFNYSDININLFNVDKYVNIDVQDLDYKFIGELDKNPSRFKVYKSNQRYKDMFIWPMLLFIFFTLLYILIQFAFIPNCESIVKAFVEDMEPSEISLTVTLFTYIAKQSLIASQVFSIVSFIVSIMTFLVHRPFRSTQDGRFKIVITDGIGFYLIDCDKSNYYDNGLEKLYFVKYVSSELNIDLDHCVISVSYYSSYGVSMRESNYYVLDLPNDGISFSNAYDFEFHKRDYRNGAFKDICNYLDETESGDVDDE